MATGQGGSAMDTGMSEERLQDLDRAISRALRETSSYDALADWKDVLEVARQLPALRGEMDKVRRAVEPPLQHAVYLGPCDRNDHDAEIAIGGTRLQVNVAPGVSLAGLRPGHDVLINKDQNIVDVGGPYLRGEAAEVVNIVKPEGCAEIKRVLDTSADGSARLRVMWREQEVEATCPPDLAGRVRRGDVVRLAPETLTVQEKVRPRLHVHVGGGDGIIVEIGDELHEQGVQVADIVRVDSTLKYAFEKLPAYEIGGLALEDVPDVTFEDIGGLEKELDHIYDAIQLPYLHAAEFERFQLTRPKGILLYGPPGCGKTMVAKAVANALTQSIRDYLLRMERFIEWNRRLQGDAAAQAGVKQEFLRAGYGAAAGAAETDLQEIRRRIADALSEFGIDDSNVGEQAAEIRRKLDQQNGIRSFFVNVKGPELLNKYVGETEHRIRKLFEEARRNTSFYTPVVIFFDEMESMFRTRGSGRSSDVETTIVPQFLAEIDGVEGTENLIIIGATNRQDMIDPAILRPGRLDVKIRVSTPDRAGSCEIFSRYLIPTLPLTARDLPQRPHGAFANPIVFGAGYRALKEKGVRETVADAHLATLLDLLPFGCDLRLLTSFSAAELAALETLPAYLKPGDAAARIGEAQIGEPGDLGRRLALLRNRCDIGALVAAIQRLAREKRERPALAEAENRLLDREAAAEALILHVVDLIFDPGSVLVAGLSSGANHTLRLAEFVSGAVIANIVSRAKKRALKRQLSLQRAPDDGVSFADLRDALTEEFEENKEQIVHNTLIHTVRDQGERVIWVELQLVSPKANIWDEERARPYRHAQTVREHDNA